VGVKGLVIAGGWRLSRLRSRFERKGGPVRDVVFVAVTVGFFGLAAAYIGACARIVGREALVEVPVEPEAESVTRVEARS
jgi:hypothetical protein